MTEIKHYHFGVNFVIDILRGKWRAPIICALRHQSLRYSALQHYLNQYNSQSIAKKVLTEQLKELEELAIVQRQDLSTPKHSKVIYSLTDKGRELSDFMVSISKFGESLADELTTSDQQYQFEYSYRQNHKAD